MKMDYRAWVNAAVKRAEKEAHLKSGWWGTWTEVNSPSGRVKVKFISSRPREYRWVITENGVARWQASDRYRALRKAEKVEKELEKINPTANETSVVVDIKKR